MKCWVSREGKRCGDCLTPIHNSSPPSGLAPPLFMNWFSCPWLVNSSGKCHSEGINVIVVIDWELNAVSLAWLYIHVGWYSTCWASMFRFMGRRSSIGVLHRRISGPASCSWLLVLRPSRWPVFQVREGGATRALAQQALAVSPLRFPDGLISGNWAACMLVRPR